MVALTKTFGPSRKGGIEGCWYRLRSLCHKDPRASVDGVGEAVGTAPEHLEQVVGGYLEGLVPWWSRAGVS